MQKTKQLQTGDQNKAVSRKWLNVKQIYDKIYNICYILYIWYK